MRTLGIDIETFSSVDLKKSGVYPYVESPDFEILLFAYAFDYDPVQIIDLAQGEQLPDEIAEALQDPKVLKTAHNANFERTAIRKFFKMILPVNQWECTMTTASMLGLPLSLDAAAKALKLSHQKDTAGKNLIRYFSVPCKPTKTNGQRTRNLPQHDLEKWNQYKGYCVQDVVVEREIRRKVSFFNVPATEKKLWQLDQTINDRGILVDPEFVKNAIALDYQHNQDLTKEAIEITSLDNPNSVAQLKKWLEDATGEQVTSLNKKEIPKLLESTACETTKRVLQLRQEMSKTSIKKYAAMQNARCSDSRIRGLLQYYGANRTGRWAGRLVQVQNLRKNDLPDLDTARELVKGLSLDWLQLLYGSVPDVLSQLIRTAFVAKKGHRFIVADFSAIEARVIAWLAGEKWRLDVFNTHGKIYEASAAQMFKVPIESITKGSDLRQKGKVAELALGYQGGPNALITMGALDMGIAMDDLEDIVHRWRAANPAIKRYWYTIGNAAIECVESGEPVNCSHGIRFLMEKGVLFIELPSKRRLAYMRPKVIDKGDGFKQLFYQGMDQTTKRWGYQTTYGGKLVENIVQAAARDCLANAMLRVDQAGYKIVMHVHDEIVCEMPYGKGSVEEINSIMGADILWAKGLPLTADSYETEYYKKD